MRLRFLGHAAFDLQFGGVRLCLDPHKPGALGGRFRLPAISGPFDAIALTHVHEDHAAWTPALGTTERIDGPGQVGAVTVDARAAFHDGDGGTRMGLVRMMSFRAEGLRVVHCGDLGAFDPGDVAWLQGTDVLLVPAGGTWTLDPAGAIALVRAVQPKLWVAMHCADPHVDLALRPLDEVLALWDGPVEPHAELHLTEPPPPGPPRLVVWA